MRARRWKIHTATGDVLRICTISPSRLQQITASVEHDLGLMDGIVLPVAFLVLAMVVRSIRLLVATLCCIGLSVALSFALVYIMATQITVLSFVPSFMVRACPLLVTSCWSS